MNHIQLHIIPEWYLLELAWFAARPLLRGRYCEASAKGSA
jgi:hypothetical protein